MTVLTDITGHVTATTGTGTMTLGGAIDSASRGKFRTFAQAGIPDGATVSYGLLDLGTGHRETCRGVYTATGTTLTRVTLASTNGNNPIDLSGNAEVVVTALERSFGMELLQVEEITSAVGAVDLVNFDPGAFAIHEILYRSLEFSSAFTQLHMRVSDDGGTTFASTGYSWAGHGRSGGSGLTANASDAAQFRVDVASALAGHPANGRITLFENRSFHALSTTYSSASNAGQISQCAGGTKGIVGPMDAARIYPAAGDFTAGSLYLYGVRS